MNAIVVHEFGGPGVMQMETMPDPKPSAGEVLVRVRAVGVNPVETYIRAGTYPVLPKLPYIPGTDGAGDIEAIGDGVTNLKVGDRVYISRPASGMGAYASFVVARANETWTIPNSISHAQAAAIGVPYVTAYRALFDRAVVKKGETVLIHGATGGVGLAAVQLAVAYGCVVLGTGGSAKGRELVLQQGAAKVFDHHAAGYLDEIKKTSPSGAGVNAIVEMASHQNLDKDLDLLARGGRVVCVGSRGKIEIDPRKTFVKELAILGMSMWAGGEERVENANRAIGEGLRNGSLKPVVDDRLRLEQASAAHEDVMKGQSLGKIVLKVSNT